MNGILSEIQHDPLATPSMVEAPSTLYLIGLKERDLEELRGALGGEVKLIATLQERLPESPDEDALCVLAVQAEDGSGLCGMDAWCSLASTPLPWVAVVPKSSPTLRFLCHHTGALRLFEEQSFAASFRRWLSHRYEPFAPREEAISLLSSIHMAHQLKLSAQIEVTPPWGDTHGAEEVKGWIGVEQGELLYARTSQGLEGLEALAAIVAWKRAQRQIFASAVPLQRNIEGAFADTLAQLAEDWDAAPRQLSPGPGERPAYLAELFEPCREIVQDAQDALACAVLEPSSGALLAFHHNHPTLPGSRLDPLAASASKLLRGQDVRQLEGLLSLGSSPSAMQEAFVRTQDTYTYLKALPKRDAVVLLVLRSTANQGLGWLALEQACLAIEEAL